MCSLHYRERYSRIEDFRMSMDIRDVAARYLAYRSRTVHEMRLHLRGKGFEEETVEEVISDFIECGYLDDYRYCSQYFDYAFGKGKGKRLVFAELKEKGIDSDTMTFAFEDREEEFDEKTRARKEAQKVLNMADLDPEERPDERLLAKIARRLQSKGYNSDTIYNVIGELRR